jgi:hypothetical protein
MIRPIVDGGDGTIEYRNSLFYFLSCFFWVFSITYIRDVFTRFIAIAHGCYCSSTARVVLLLVPAIVLVDITFITRFIVKASIAIDPSQPKSFACLFQPLFLSPSLSSTDSSLSKHPLPLLHHSPSHPLACSGLCSCHRSNSSSTK